MSSLPGSLEVAPGVRLRPVPEAGVCLAYTPARPELHRLNAGGWLLVSLCDGRRVAAVIAAYRAATGDDAVPDADIHATLAGFVDLGILAPAAEEQKEADAA